MGGDALREFPRSLRHAARGPTRRRAVKRRPRIDVVLERQPVRAVLEEFKHLYCVTLDRDFAGDRDGHEVAALEARGAAMRIVDAVLAEPGNATLPRRPIYHYIINVAFYELAGPIATRQQLKEVELTVLLRAGRPPTRRPRARQRLIEELTARPTMLDWRLEARARELGVWTADQADDTASRRRRIKRLRGDAAT